MTTEPVRQLKRPLIPARFFWPGMILGLMSMSLTVCVITVTMAVGDPTFAVEPAYDQKALEWDQVVIQRERNESLGWTARVNADASPSIRGDRTVRITLADRDGAPVAGASVEALLFAHVRRGEALQTAFIEAGPGEYEAVVPMQRDGLWQFRITAQADGRRYTADIDHMIGGD